jgi:peptide/nickel transport system substrate-binding protein
MTNKRSLGIGSILIFLILTCNLVACSQNASVTQTPSSVVIVIPEDPPSFNAMISDTGYDALVMELVLLGLTDLDPNGNVVPELAACLPTVENGDVIVDENSGSMDVTWRMRPDVTWQDGVPVTAQDVIFTYEAIANPETGGWIPGLDYIESVEKVDDLTLIVHYSSVYPGYLLQFGGEQVVVWPAHYCNAEQGFIAWDCARQPLSNGPYTLEEWVVGDHLTFVRNPRYYQTGKPTIERILVRIIPDNTVRKTMLMQGDADVYPWVTEPIANDLETQANVTLSVSPTSRWVMRLFPNLAARGTTDPVATPHPILSDVRVRQAIRSAIDVSTISEQIFYAYGQPTWSEFFRPPYNTCNIPRPVFDPEAAQALLEQAGWTDTDGDGIRECHGCATAPEGTLMEMEMITYSEYGEALVLTEQLIGEMLANIGLRVRLTTMEGSVIWADFASGGIEQRGDFDIDLYDDGYAGVDPTDFLWQYYAADSALPDNGWNIGRWYNEEMNTLLGEAYTLNETARQEIFCRMAEILDQEVPQILLFTTINADAFNNRLRGLQASPNDMVTWNVADWTLTAP